MIVWRLVLRFVEVVRVVLIGDLLLGGVVVGGGWRTL
jgi:hypothetical protein